MPNLQLVAAYQYHDRGLELLIHDTDNHVYQELYYDTFQEVADAYGLAYEDNYVMPFLKALSLAKQLKQNRNEEWFKQAMQRELDAATTIV